MSSRLPTDEALEKEDGIDEMKKKISPPVPHLLQAQQAPALPCSNRPPLHWKLPSTIARPNHPLFLDLTSVELNDKQKSMTFLNFYKILFASLYKNFLLYYIGQTF